MAKFDLPVPRVVRRRSNGLLLHLKSFIVIVVLATFASPIAWSSPDERVVSPDPLSASRQLADEARATLATDPARAAVLAKAAGDSASESVGDGRRRAVVIAESEWLRGDAALRLHQGAVSKPLLTIALDTVVKEQPGSRLHADILESRARLESTSADLQSGLVDFLSAFQIYKRLGDAHSEAVALQDIGLLYNDAGDYERALSYYSESKATFSGSPILDLLSIAKR